MRTTRNRGQRVVPNFSKDAQVLRRVSPPPEDEHFGFPVPTYPFMSSTNVISTDSDIIDIADLYTVGNPLAMVENEQLEARPFLSGIEIHNKTGEVVRVTAFVDSGAMTNVMCTETWQRTGRRLGKLEASHKKLRMANGTVIGSEGVWQGTIEWGGKKVCGRFEVFPSGGAWSFLLGKPLLERFGAIHRYDTDTILLRVGTHYVELHNKTKTPRRETESNEKQVEPQVQSVANLESEPPKRDIIEEPKAPRRKTQVTTGLRQRRRHNQGSLAKHGETECTVISEADDFVQVAPITEQGAGNQWSELPVDDNTQGTTVYTRLVDPHKPERVTSILSAITLGQDLTDNQAATVRKLIAEFADCFALSVSEVTAVKDAVHHLNIKPDTSFSKSIHQRPLTPPQRQYLNTKIDELLAAGIIEQCSPSDVKCIAPIILAQKAHEGQGLTLDELRYRVNEECVAAGLEPAFETGTKPTRNKEQKPGDQKWRICMNYGEINKHTVIAPMPQGDIRLKQQNVSGHRWVCTFDFASGFYAVTIDPKSRPYTCFYVEGRGYFWCVRMPFGLTGAPSTFAEMTAKHLHDLLADGTMELFVDDGASADDNFDSMMEKLRRILERVRDRGLSLSPSKSKFFMTSAPFAGAIVGPQGVTPDLGKVTAVVDWPQPKDALNLASFLGLTGHFRDLIKNYARLEGPLRDLLRTVDLPKNYSKTTYRRIMKGTNLEGSWGRKHTEAFLNLKKALTSEPVLRCPQWDGTPFIVTTDGCQDGFGAVLTQRFSTVLENGRTVSKLHPIAFASKRTSAALLNNNKPYID